MPLNQNNYETYTLTQTGDQVKEALDASQKFRNLISGTTQSPDHGLDNVLTIVEVENEDEDPSAPPNYDIAFININDILDINHVLNTSDLIIDAGDASNQIESSPAQPEA